VIIDDPGIVDLDWDDWNLEHITKHAVSREEVQEVIALRPVFQQAYKGRFLAIGPTQAGRMLAVVVGPVPDRFGSYYVFSARPASRKERRHYGATKGDKIS
jgi:uncharacterized DUF497 family protein